MATLIQELCHLLKPISGIRVDYQPDEMLVTLPTAGGRRQAVKVWTEKCRHDDYHLVRLRSRATAAKDHRMIIAILNTNANLELGGLGLDLSTNPPAVDVLYSCVGDQILFTDFLTALQRIAAFADSIEQRTNGSDNF